MATQRRCTGAYVCNYEQKDSSGMGTTCMDDNLSPTKHLGRAQIELPGLCGAARHVFYEYLASVTAIEKLVRNGTTFETANYIDSRTNHVCILFVLVTPQSGVLSIVSPQIQMGTAVEGSYTIKHYTSVSGGALTMFKIWAVCHILLLVYVVVDVIFLLAVPSVRVFTRVTHPFDRDGTVIEINKNRLWPICVGFDNGQVRRYNLKDFRKELKPVDAEYFVRDNVRTANAVMLMVLVGMLLVYQVVRWNQVSDSENFLGGLSARFHAVPYASTSPYHDQKNAFDTQYATGHRPLYKPLAMQYAIKSTGGPNLRARPRN